MFGLLALRGLAPCRDRRRGGAGHTPGGRVPGALGERQGALGEGVRLRQSGQPADAPLPGRDDRVSAYPPVRWRRLFPRLREQRHGVGDAPGQGICPPKASG